MADKFNPSSRSGKDADKYDTGKGSTGKGSQKHADKYENTREGKCKGSLAEKPVSTWVNADGNYQ